MRLADLLRRKADRLGEGAGPKVPRRQHAKAIERQQIGRGAQLTVLGGRGTERPFRQGLAVFSQLARVCPLAPHGSAHGNRLQVLAAKHRAAPSAPGVAPVVRIVA